MSKFDVNGDGKVDYKDLIAAVTKALDLNGDGEVNLQDALWGASIVGATAANVAAVGYLSGAALVSATSTAMGSTLAATGGSIAGAFTGISLGTTTVGALSVINLGSMIVVKSTLAQVVNTSAAAAVTSISTTATVAAEAASGFIAGLPIVQTSAIASLEKTGEIIVLGGFPIGIHAAIAAGLITLVICAGVVYYLRTKEQFTDEELGQLSDLDG